MNDAIAIGGLIGAVGAFFCLLGVVDALLNRGSRLERRDARHRNHVR